MQRLCRPQIVHWYVVGGLGRAGGVDHRRTLIFHGGLNTRSRWRF